MRVLYWFRDDLRVYDNPGLHEAAKRADEVVPVYVLEERWLTKDRWGFQRTGPWRLKFLLESLEDLSVQLEKLGSGLLVVRGLAEKVVPDLASQYGCEAVIAAHSYTTEEIKMERAINAQVPLELFHSSTLIHPDDAPFTPDEVPEVFTEFRKKVERYSKVREPRSAPKQITGPQLQKTELPDMAELLGLPVPPHDERAVMRFRGGTAAGYDRLDHYYWNTDAVQTYKETRNGLIGADYSTKFSPWLANGSLSPRVVYWDLEDYEKERRKNQSTYWVKFELFWRDYFKFIAMKHGSKLFQQGGILQRTKKWRNNPGNFRKWALGQTGDRFVDANMQELLHTGFMSNRGRQNVASFLVHRYREDWRKGAAWFESLLVDYDPASNYGNWAYNSGVGNDPRDRVFNTELQASRYDGNGAYRALWLDRDPMVKGEEMASFIASL